MKKLNRILPIMLIASLATFALMSGCNPTSNSSSDSAARSAAQAKDDAKASKAKGNSDQMAVTSQSTNAEFDSEHGHKAGSHGGIMVSLGRDSYHIEAVIDSEGAIRLHTLGKDETRVIDVESQSLKGFVKEDGANDSQSITFEPSPQEGDGDNKTSLFIGKLPKELIGRKLDVTIPNIRIAGERFRLGFQTSQERHSSSSEMPDKIGDDAEQELYLTPGGRYTAADIVANGNATASQKFKGFKSVHDMNPKMGDRICPITETKSNPKCAWVVDGKLYQFCCPPCVDEFVKLAKSSSDALPDPESYVKK